MTLIISFNVGDIASILTCDTRQVINFFGKELRIKDSDRKIHKISENAICAGGGMDAVFDYVVSLLKKFQLTSMADIYGKLTIIDEMVQKQFRKSFNKDEVSQIFFTGLSEIGTSSILYYLPHEKSIEDRIKYEILNRGGFSISCATPESFLTADWFGNDLANIRKTLHGGMSNGEILQQILGSIGLVHYKAYEHDPVDVSEWMCYAAILRDPSSASNVFIDGKLNVLGGESDE